MRSSRRWTSTPRRQSSGGTSSRFQSCHRPANGCSGPASRRLTAQAPPMREWSPYRGVNPPHLAGYFRATQGEFRLSPLSGNRTRLEGRTRYVVDMFPQSYWTLPADRLVTAIHRRVLRHIKAVAEEEDHP